ncbi:MAG: hypothetical protein HRT73_09040 [Flavobacteriales bacterium]|nr:hypothetical protein [Flavobacteriales bacterium]
MKNFFLLVLIIPVVLCAQKNNTGTLKIRKHPKIHAYASVAGIFEGMITRETLLSNPVKIKK